MSTSLKKIAARIRSDLQHSCINIEKLAVWYHAYNSTIKNPKEFVVTAVRQFPKLACGVAAVYMSHIVARGRPHYGFYGKNPHTFLLLGDGSIIDITADQYGGPPVYFGPLRQPWSL